MVLDNPKTMVLRLRPKNYCLWMPFALGSPHRFVQNTLGNRFFDPKTFFLPVLIFNGPSNPPASSLVVGCIGHFTAMSFTVPLASPRSLGAAVGAALSFSEAVGSPLSSLCATIPLSFGRLNGGTSTKRSSLLPAHGGASCPTMLQVDGAVGYFHFHCCLHMLEDHFLGDELATRLGGVTRARVSSLLAAGGVPLLYAPAALRLPLLAAPTSDSLLVSISSPLPRAMPGHSTFIPQKATLPFTILSILSSHI